MEAYKVSFDFEKQTLVQPLMDIKQMIVGKKFSFLHVVNMSETKVILSRQIFSRKIDGISQVTMKT